MESDFPLLSQKKAFLFDYGDTLVKYYKGSEFYPILKKGMRDISDFLNKHQVPTDPFKVIWNRAITENYESPDYKVRPLSDRLRRIFHLSIEYEGFMDKIQELFLKSIHSVALLYDDSIPTLKQLKQSYNITNVIVSNTPWGTPADYWHKELENFQLDVSQKYIDFTALCVDVGWRKPATVIFEYVMDSLKLNPKECIFIGDNPKWDIYGPKKLGIDAILLDRNNIYPYLPIPRIRNLMELFQFF